MRPRRCPDSMSPQENGQNRRLPRCSHLATALTSGQRSSERPGCWRRVMPPCCTTGPASPHSRPTGEPKSFGGYARGLVRRSVRPSAGCAERSKRSKRSTQTRSRPALPRDPRGASAASGAIRHRPLRCPHVTATRPHGIVLYTGGRKPDRRDDGGGVRASRNRRPVSQLRGGC